MHQMPHYSPFGLAVVGPISVNTAFQLRDSWDLPVDQSTLPEYYLDALRPFSDLEVKMRYSRQVPGSRPLRALWKGHLRFRTRGSSGQSFVELSILVLVLMLLVAGIGEYGVLLNRYLNMLDGAREAARYNANFNPFCPQNSTDPLCPAGTVTPDYYVSTAKMVNQVLYPVLLDPPSADDILVSFFVVEHGAITSRYPVADGENGWSWSQHYAGYGIRNHTSKQSSSFILSRMDPSAPDVSVSLVEIFYNYHQTLRMPMFLQFIPDPIPVYTYAIMPIKNVTPP
jgi:hypothetical protein